VDPDDPPILDDAPARSLDVPARAVQPRGSRPAVAAVGAIAICVALVGFAYRPTGEGPAGVAPTFPSPRLAVAPDPIAVGPFFSLPPDYRPVEVLDLASPGPGTVQVASTRLTVAGRVLVRAARVEIVLAASGNRLFGQASASVFDPDGGIRPAVEPSFEVQFDLSAAPRPVGTMQVVVTAYDAAGAPLGGVRRAISIVPLDGG
jgi:hypothetical protein